MFGLFRQSRGSKGQAAVFTSSATVRMQESQTAFREDKHAEFGLTKAYPNRLKQSVIGFGGAFTEATAHIFSQMDGASQEAILRHYFSSEGCNYTLCRTHIQSCDFALGNYAHVSGKADKALDTFSLAREAEHMIPMMQRAAQINSELEILASPWSPPAFMKTNKSMNRGGRLKPKCYGQWAQMIARYVGEMRAQGIPVTRLSVQNEPMAVQLWDSCLYSAEEELTFLRDYLKPALAEAGLGDINVLVWDHNKDRILDRIEGMPGFEETADGVAFHWYTGDHFEALAEVAREYPGQELIMTEMCLGHSQRPHSDARNAEQYAHEIIGDFNAGAQGFIDWNMLLDMKGGPNHVGNFCNAPVMADPKAGTFDIGLESTYIAHFSRFVQRGARLMVVSRASQAIEAVGFVNPQGEKVVVALNRQNSPYTLQLAEGTHVLKLELAGHSIATIAWE